MGRARHARMDGAPIAYGDLRMRTERRNGCCLFWVRDAPFYPPSLPGS